MPDKKSDKKSAAKDKPPAMATKSAHDALVKRVGVIEAHVAGLAGRLNIDLGEFES